MKKNIEICKKLFENISEFIDGEIDKKKKNLIEKHIKECEPCLKYVGSFVNIRECLKKEGEKEPDICELVKECVKKFLSEKND